MSKFAVEVRVQGMNGPEWRQMKPTNGKPYRFDTEDQAENIRKM